MNRRLFFASYFWLAVPALIGALVWALASAPAAGMADLRPFPWWQTAGSSASGAALPARRTALGAGLYAVWAENQSTGSVLWAAAPGAILDRVEVLRFETDSIIAAALSPDGDAIAVVAAAPGAPRMTLRVIRRSTAEGTIVDESTAIGSPTWGPDGRLAYISEVQAVVEIEGKEGRTVMEGRGSELRIWDPATNAVRTVASAGAGGQLSVNGWTAGGRSLLFSSSAPAGDGLPAMRMGAVGEGAPLLDGGGPGGTALQIDPRGQSILAGMPDGLFAATLDGRSRVLIARAAPGFSAAWAADGRDVLITYWDSAASRMGLRAVDAGSGAARDVRGLPGGGEWRLLSASPDGRWVAAYQYYTGTYFLALDSESDPVLLPQDADPVQFIGWLLAP